MSFRQKVTGQINRSWKRTFFVIWIGQAFSLIGSNLVQFALVWWLTKTTGSPAVLATATFVALLPNVFLGPFAGALVDRWNRRKVMILADASVAFATLVLVILFWSGLIQIWHVYIIMFIRALGSAFHWPAMRASTSLMVPEIHLSRIAGLNEALGGMMNIVSPPLGALLLEALPMQQVLSIDILTAFLAILPLLFVSIPQPQKMNAEKIITPKGLMADVAEGYRYMAKWTGLFILTIMAMVVNFMVNPAFTLTPLLVTKYFNGGVWHLSWMESVFSIGVVTGGLVLSVWGGFKRQIFTTLMGVTGMGLGILLITFAPQNMFFLAVIGMAFTGFMNPITNGPLFTIMQARVAPEMQGRVFTLLNSLSSAMSPLGMLVAAPVAEQFGIRAWFLLGGISCILLAIIGLLIPAVVHIEDNHKSQEMAVGSSSAVK
jgi:DHA3 family macrolide efflux protein-like MFS transporter